MGFALYDRGQAFPLTPDMRDWLPANHIIHFIVRPRRGTGMPSQRHVRMASVAAVTGLRSATDGFHPPPMVSSAGAVVAGSVRSCPIHSVSDFVPPDVRR